MSFPSSPIAFDKPELLHADQSAWARARTVLALAEFAFPDDKASDVHAVSSERAGIAFRDLSRRTQPAGIEIRAPALGRLQDADAILAQRLQAERKPRSPRFALELSATLSAREGKAWLRTVDISAGGIKLRGKTPIAAGGRGVIRLAGLGLDLRGVVRWKAGNLSGFQFEKPMSRCDLFSLLSRR